jgi:hypothetical protein
MMFASAALLAVTVSAGPATAAVVDACSIGQYPNAPAGQSNLKAACTFTSASVGSSTTIVDSPLAMWHNGAAWTQAGAVITSGSNIVTAATGHFQASDFHHTISNGAVGIVNGSFITAVNSPTSITISMKATSSVSGQTVKIENTTARRVTDSVVTNGSTTLTSATANFDAATDTGRVVSGTNLPAYDTIAVVNTPTSVTLSAAANGTATAQALTIGANEMPDATTRQIMDAQISGNTLTSATANFSSSNSGDLQLPVTGCSIPAGAYIASVTNPTTVQLSAPATAVLPLAFADGVTTSGSKTVTSATANFSTCDVGKTITGAGIPANAKIATFTNSTTVVLGAAATATATGVSLTVGTEGEKAVIGLPTVTAPASGDVMSSLSTALPLSPSLVPGSPKCTLNVPTGSTIEGQWENPGAFAATALSTFVPSGAIAQILYNTSVVGFSAFVMPVAAGAGADPQPAAHYDVVFASLPTGLALCPSSPAGLGSTFQFAGSTPTIQGKGAAAGRTGSAYVRSLNGLGSGVPSQTNTLYLITNKPLTFSTSCLTTYPGDVNFVCGNG